MNLSSGKKILVLTLLVAGGILFWGLADQAQAITCECGCQGGGQTIINDPANDACASTGYSMCQTACSALGFGLSYAMEVCQGCTFSQCQPDIMGYSWICATPTPSPTATPAPNCGINTCNLLFQTCCSGSICCDSVTEFCDSDAAGNIFCSPISAQAPNCGTIWCDPQTQLCCGGTFCCNAMSEFCDSDAAGNVFCSSLGGGGGTAATCSPACASGYTCSTSAAGVPTCVSTGGSATCSPACGPGYSCATNAAGNPVCVASTNPGAGVGPPVGNATLPNFFGFTTISALMTAIANFIITYIAAPLAVIMIIYSGFLFVTAGGNEEKLRKAKKNLLWTLVGVAIIWSANVLITYIQSLLSGTGVSGATTFFNSLKAPLNQAIVIVFALATIYFIWGFVQFMRASGSGDEQGITTGKRHMVWGIVGMAIMSAAPAIISFIASII